MDLMFGDLDQMLGLNTGMHQNYAVSGAQGTAIDPVLYGGPPPPNPTSSIFGSVGGGCGGNNAHSTSGIFGPLSEESSLYSPGTFGSGFGGSPSCGSAFDTPSIFGPLDCVGGGGGGGVPPAPLQLPSPGWSVADDSFVLSQFAAGFGMEVGEQEQKLQQLQQQHRNRQQQQQQQQQHRQQHPRQTAAAAGGGRNSIGPNQTDLDAKLRTHFPVEVLTQNKDAWRATVAHYGPQMTAGELTRLKQIRRRELQKSYNKGLRDRKRNAAQQQQQQQQQQQHSSLFGGL